MNCFNCKAEEKYKGNYCKTCHLIRRKEKETLQTGRKTLLQSISCINCETKFNQTNINQKICSVSCRNKYIWIRRKNLRTKKFCLSCNEVEIPFSFKFCSGKCKTKYHYTPKPRTLKKRNNCKNCNGLTKNRIFCSLKCKGMDKHNTTPKKRKNKTILIKLCKECGNNFEALHSQRIYCSKKCIKIKNKFKKKQYDIMRELSKRNRVPAWANKRHIREFYNNCPKGMVVSHKEPLNSEFVSGLHVVDNLEYLTPEQVVAKELRGTPKLKAKP